MSAFTLVAVEVWRRVASLPAGVSGPESRVLIGNYQATVYRRSGGAVDAASSATGLEAIESGSVAVSLRAGDNPGAALVDADAGSVVHPGDLVMQAAGAATALSGVWGDVVRARVYGSDLQVDLRLGTEGGTGVGGNGGAAGGGQPAHAARNW